jgi:hypothetical protein
MSKTSLIVTTLSLLFALGPLAFAQDSPASATDPTIERKVGRLAFAFCSRICGLLPVSNKIRFPAYSSAEYPQSFCMPVVFPKASYRTVICAVPGILKEGTVSKHFRMISRCVVAVVLVTCTAKLLTRFPVGIGIIYAILV